MTPFLIRILTALAGILVLSATACAESTTETEAATDEAVAETSLAQAEPEAPAPQPGADIVAAAGPDAWRTVNNDNLLLISTRHGPIYIELAPEFAPRHVERLRELAAENYYDYKVWHRVIDDFMAQGGGALNNPNEGPDKPALEAEFTRMRGSDLEISELQRRAVNPRSGNTQAMAGFWNGFPAGTQPIAQAAIRADGLVESWLLHCPGSAAMARTNDPNSGRGQFYIVRRDARHLDTQYTVWGYTRIGLDAVLAIKVGSLADNPYFEPDFIEDVNVVSSLPADEQPVIEVMDTNSQAFADYLSAIADANDGALPDICQITVPTRMTE